MNVCMQKKQILLNTKKENKKISVINEQKKNKKQLAIKTINHLILCILFLSLFYYYNYYFV